MKISLSMWLSPIGQKSIVLASQSSPWKMRRDCMKHGLSLIYCVLPCWHECLLPVWLQARLLAHAFKCCLDCWEARFLANNHSDEAAEERQDQLEPSRRDLANFWDDLYKKATESTKTEFIEGSSVMVNHGQPISTNLARSLSAVPEHPQHGHGAQLGIAGDTSDFRFWSKDITRRVETSTAYWPCCSEWLRVDWCELYWYCGSWIWYWFMQCLGMFTCLPRQTVFNEYLLWISFVKFIYGGYGGLFFLFFFLFFFDFWFSASLLLCFSAFPCFFASLLFPPSLHLRFSLLACFSSFLRFPAVLLLCFSASLLSASLLFCFFASLLLWFSAFLFSVSLPLCFSAFMLFPAFCFSSFFASLLSTFPCFSAYLLLCFSLLFFYFSYWKSTPRCIT